MLLLLLLFGIKALNLRVRLNEKKNLNMVDDFLRENCYSVDIFLLTTRQHFDEFFFFFLLLEHRLTVREISVEGTGKRYIPPAESVMRYKW